MIKWIGWAFLLAALGILAADVYVSFHAEGPVRLAALGEWWFWLDKQSLQVLQPAIERHVSASLWPPVQQILEWPLAAELAVIGLVLVVLGRRRKAPRPDAED